ncbi:MAG: DUF362 domain-containing protein [Bacteroidales bacterium]|nr:DUF362 domain-containing protein [Bacteroidales bacterium]
MTHKVYFTNLRTAPGNHQLDKLERLVKAAGIETIDFKNKFTAIKVHVGEPGNMAYLRPNYAATIVRIVKELGGKPFLTDCNTLYTGGRSNAVDHMDSAMHNGYSPMSTGAQFIVADGLKGLDYKEIPLNGEYCKAPKIGLAIAEADALISINHVKGHEMAGFGGALKNLGMGCGSVAGKKEMHCNSKPVINEANCIGCGLCVRHCAQGAISIQENRKAHIDQSKCVGCGQCVATCQSDAAAAKQDSTLDELNCKIAEYAKATMLGKQTFHVSIIIDVSPECDCWGYNDTPIVPNIGMAASFDPVALDCACCDLVNKTPVLENGNVLTDHYSHDVCMHDHDHWDLAHPDTNWKSCVAHAEKIGIGERAYELIEVK